MCNELKAREYKCFEDIKQRRADGSFFWSARDLACVLGYIKWNNFQTVLKRAMIACENSGHNSSCDFPEVGKIVRAGATTKRVKDYELSRLIAATTLDSALTLSSPAEKGDKKRPFLRGQRSCSAESSGFTPQA